MNSVRPCWSRFAANAITLTVTALLAMATTAVAISLTKPAAAATASCPSGTALYGIAGNGELYGYFDSDPYHGTGEISGTGMVKPNWGGLSHVFSGGHGVIYGVASDGTLRSYKDYHTFDAKEPVTLKIYGPGWDQFRLLWGNAYGVIYGIQNDGTLTTYKQDAPEAGDGSITHIRDFNATWGNIRFAWSSGKNQFYGITATGELHTYLHTGYVAGNGTITGGSYANPSWGGVRLAWSPAPGVIYGINSGTLSSYRDASPDTGAGPITSIKSNINSTWGNVDKVFPDQQACVSAPFDPGVGGSTGSAMVNSAVEFALDQVGKPYVWGAKGPNAYDCSGLVWHSYYQAGYGWARTTAEGQYEYGTKVSRSNMKRGDLVFWSSNGVRSGIYHVAIYLGGGEIVAAASVEIGVVRQDLWDGGDLMPYAVRLG